jgi:hypothetical protein
MILRMLLASAVIGAITWILSGRIGFERGFEAGYAPEHAARVALQTRLDAHSNCLSAIEIPTNPPDQNDEYRAGYILGSTENCNRKSGFAYFTGADFDVPGH